jgi:hypothetical protein
VGNHHGNMTGTSLGYDADFKGMPFGTIGMDFG